MSEVDVLALEIDRHEATDVYVFEVSGDIAREMTEWSHELELRFDRDKHSKRLVLLVRKPPAQTELGRRR